MLPAHTATADDCTHIYELLEMPMTDMFVMGILEIISPLELSVTAVYTANEISMKYMVDLEVVQIDGKEIKG
jgi:hypothetical protein